MKVAAGALMHSTVTAGRRFVPSGAEIAILPAQRRESNKPKDFTEVLEAVYTPQTDDRTWLHEAAMAIRPLFDLGQGVFATFLTASAASSKDAVLLGCGEAFPRFAIELMAELADDPARNLKHADHRLTTAQECLRWSRGEALPGRLQRLAEECGIVDAALLFIGDPSGFGLFLAAPLRRAWKLSRRQRSRWSMVAGHLAAGYRLQRHSSIVSVDQAENSAVGCFGESPYTLGPGAEKKSQDWLRDVARSAACARSPTREDDSNDTLAIWEGLVAGRWSLVDRFERDGRRYLVARKNDPEEPAPMALTRREQQVVRHAVLGRSNKFMAYELGVSQSHISECLKRARTKLGLRSTTELIRLAGRLTSLTSRGTANGQP